MPGLDSACLDEDSLLALVEGRIGPERRRVEQHVDACDECRALVAALARASGDADERPSLAAPTPLPDRLAARYALLRRIGFGPNGSVFVARDLARDELVAIKWIHDRLARRKGVPRQARALVERLVPIDHPNILRVLGCHFRAGALIIVSELSDGESLAGLLAEREISASHASDVAIQLVSALAAAHGSGIVHGDVKAENVLVNLAGQVLVSDFGVASLRGMSLDPAPGAKRADVRAVAKLALELLGRVRGRVEPLRSVFQNCLEKAAIFRSAVELEAALREALDRTGRGIDGDGALWIPAPGQILGGRYRVEGLIGVGGMSVVVSALQIDLGRRVAIKLMPPRAAKDPAAVARFMRQARVGATVACDHVVRIYGAGRTDDGTPYMVMEYLVGATLGRLVQKRGALPIEEAVTLVLQASVAIAECHARGIVHRDLKPDNIMVLEQPAQRGLVKVLDFGISKFESPDDSTRLTATVDVLGTPSHMSPEQIKSAKRVDARTDIWALGVILYELVTGKPPFDASTLTVLSARIEASEPVPPHVHRPDLPLALEAVIASCLAKRPADRPPSVGDLAERLFPFAPRSAYAYLERIRAISAPRAPRAPAPAALAPSPSILSTAAWQRYLVRRGASRRASVIFGAAVGLALSAALVWVFTEDGSVTEPARTGAASAAAALARAAPNALADEQALSAKTRKAQVPAQRANGRTRDPLGERF